MKDCPQCGTHPLGTSFVVDLTTRGGTGIEAILCGGCGVVYVEDPQDEVFGSITEDSDA